MDNANGQGRNKPVVDGKEEAQMSKARPLVRIDWVDSCRHEGWRNPSDVVGRSDLRCTSIGFLVDDSPDSLVIASHIAWPEGPDPLVGAMQSIPRCSVTKISRLGKSLTEPSPWPTGKRRKR